MQWESFSHWKKGWIGEQGRLAWIRCCSGCLIWVMDLLGAQFQIKNPWLRAVGLPDYIPKLNTNILGIFWRPVCINSFSQSLSSTPPRVTSGPLSLGHEALTYCLVIISRCFLPATSPQVRAFGKHNLCLLSFLSSRADVPPQLPSLLHQLQQPGKGRARTERGNG